MDQLDMQRRIKIMRTLNIKAFKEQLLKDGSIDSLDDLSDLDALGAMHKARYESQAFSRSEKWASRKWLQNNNMKRLRGQPW